MLKICKVDPNNIFGNWVYVSDKDYPAGSIIFGKISSSTGEAKEIVFQLKQVPWIQQGHIGLNVIQRKFFGVNDGETIDVGLVDGEQPKVKEIIFQLIHKDKPLENIPDEKTNNFMDYVYYGLFGTSAGKAQPDFLIPHPFDDNDVIIVHILEVKDTDGVIDNDTEMNLVH